MQELDRRGSVLIEAFANPVPVCTKNRKDHPQNKPDF
jgi:hypothetical protein